MLWALFFKWPYSFNDCSLDTKSTVLNFFYNFLYPADLKEANTGDGEYKHIYTINGQFPGPTITVYEGQQVVVKVTNKLLQEGIGIHWHGILQRNTPWMDGVPGVSHCAILPDETFTYRWENRT